MPKFRKKPIVIEAEQLLQGKPTPAHVSFGTPDPSGFIAGIPGHRLVGKYWVMTLEGPLVAQFGDWIITGVHGEHYPCKPDIFVATYEKVVDGQGEEDA